MAVSWALTAHPASQGAGATNYTFTSQNIGTPSADRIVVVFMHVEITAIASQVLGCTIGGTTANVAKYVWNTSGAAYTVGQLHEAAFYLNVPSGTTSDIVITVGGNTCAECIIGVGAITGAGASATPSATNSIDFTSAATTSPNINVNIVTGGLANFYFMADRAISNTWSGTTTNDFTTNGTAQGFTLGEGFNTTVGTPTSDTYSGTNAFYIMSAIAWAPAGGPTINPMLGRIGV